ncbi:MAG: hypothetical protein ACFB4J_07810, partial [Elainellaceae cyanobacterium]
MTQIPFQKTSNKAVPTSEVASETARPSTLPVVDNPADGRTWAKPPLPKTSDNAKGNTLRQQLFTTVLP